MWEDSLAPISWSHPHPTSLEFSGRGGGQVGLGGLLCSLIGLLQTPQVLFGLFFLVNIEVKWPRKHHPEKGYHGNLLMSWSMVGFVLSFCLYTCTSKFLKAISSIHKHYIFCVGLLWRSWYEVWLEANSVIGIIIWAPFSLTQLRVPVSYKHFYNYRPAAACSERTRVYKFTTFYEVVVCAPPHRYAFWFMNPKTTSIPYR